jgi:hypothetical protein
MNVMDDIYNKLRDPGPTPPEEMCNCAELEEIVLIYLLTSNPLTCAKCKKEVEPARLAFSVELVEAVQSWRNFYEAFYFLWLDSAEFEEWARGHLVDPKSVVNQRGLELCHRISAVRECYYWWFDDVDEENTSPIKDCPVCAQKLVSGFDRLVCKECKIIFAN